MTRGALLRSVRTGDARFIRKFVREEHGAAVVEFAFVFLLMLILVFGIVDFGRALYIANNLHTGVREGARFAAVLSDPATNAAAIKDTVVNRLYTLGGTAPKASDVTVTFNYSSGGSSALQSTTVSVVYPFSPITPIAGLIGLGTINLSASARFRWESAP